MKVFLEDVAECGSQSEKERNTIVSGGSCAVEDRDEKDPTYLLKGVKS